MCKGTFQSLAGSGKTVARDFGAWLRQIAETDNTTNLYAVILDKKAGPEPGGEKTGPATPSKLTAHYTS
jgi:hypothetical protein